MKTERSNHENTMYIKQKYIRLVMKKNIQYYCGGRLCGMNNES